MNIALDKAEADKAGAVVIMGNKKALSAGEHEHELEMQTREWGEVYRIGNVLLIYACLKTSKNWCVLIISCYSNLHPLR